MQGNGKKDNEKDEKNDEAKIDISKNEMMPMNDSISLAIDCLFARTTLKAKAVPDGEAPTDTVSINGKLTPLNHRFERVFKSVRGGLKSMWSFTVVSTTNFPVSAGLASSAAGFAALAFALGKMFDLEDNQVQDLARYGSGSASRSVLAGLVQWRKGDETTKSDVISHFTASHWPDLRLVVLVVNGDEKGISSKEGMARSVKTSELLKDRVRRNPDRIQRIINSFKLRDFASLAELIMRDSNEFHAVCLDSYPPIQYLNATSWSIINLVHDFNKECVRAAYTFDAGPNACVFTLTSDVEAFVSAVRDSFVVGHSEGCDVRDVIVSTLGEGPTIE